ncbi:hypothetical protein SLEP1_g50708 [Rubroshorea leprosula]|uniref:Uncharacterized protein n=1 Tax=Rubroshorea leprosula TaxID=152421 RepID=A0AAV5M441_9ROSI|nr:hypothetical protein SLEP1_g50708 [Rubroshorea leprosula]
MFSALSIKKSAKSEVNFQQICPPSRSSVLSIDKVR